MYNITIYYSFDEAGLVLQYGVSDSNPLLVQFKAEYPDYKVLTLETYAVEYTADDAYNDVHSYLSNS